jgi:hypothetical protein
MEAVIASYFAQPDLDGLCDWIVEGNSVRSYDWKAAKKSHKQFYKWLALFASDEQKEQYACAMESRADAIAEECLEIADNATDDVIFLTSEDGDGVGGRAAIKHSAIQRARLQIDTRKWFAGKLQPKKYGDKVQLGGDAENPVKIDTTVEIVHVHPK